LDLAILNTLPTKSARTQKRTVSIYLIAPALDLFLIQSQASEHQIRPAPPPHRNRIHASIDYSLRAISVPPSRPANTIPQPATLLIIDRICHGPDDLAQKNKKN